MDVSRKSQEEKVSSRGQNEGKRIQLGSGRGLAMYGQLSVLTNSHPKFLIGGQRTEGLVGTRGCAGVAKLHSSLIKVLARYWNVGTVLCWWSLVSEVDATKPLVK